MAELTPMMRQYKEVKRQHPDCINIILKNIGA